MPSIRTSQISPENRDNAQFVECSSQDSSLDKSSEPFLFKRGRSSTTGNVSTFSHHPTKSDTNGFDRYAADDYLKDATKAAAGAARYTNPSCSFDEIVKIERRRRALLLSVKQSNSVTVLTSFAGTLLPSILGDFQLWTSLSLYIGLRILIRSKVIDTEYVPSADMDYVITIGGFLAFFLVFYANQSYQRYNKQYKAAMQVERSIFSLTILTKSALPKFEREHCIRLVNAAHILAYIGISNSYNEQNFFNPLNEEYQLLTEEETFSVLRDESLGLNPEAQGATPYQVVLSWVSEKAVRLRQNRRISSVDYELIIDKIRCIAGNLASMFEFDDQPIPFVYLHLIFVLSLVYLPLFAFTLAVSEDLASGSNVVEMVSVITLFVDCIFVLGLRDLARILQDPYGNDLQDLSVLHYVTYTIGMCTRILKSHNPAKKSLNDTTAAAAAAATGDCSADVDAGVDAGGCSTAAAAAANGRKLQEEEEEEKVEEKEEEEGNILVLSRKGDRKRNTEKQDLQDDAIGKKSAESATAAVGKQSEDLGDELRGRSNHETSCGNAIQRQHHHQTQQGVEGGSEPIMFGGVHFTVGQCSVSQPIESRGRVGRLNGEAVDLVRESGRFCNERGSASAVGGSIKECGGQDSAGDGIGDDHNDDDNGDGEYIAIREGDAEWHTRREKGSMSGIEGGGGGGGWVDANSAKTGLESSCWGSRSRSLGMIRASFLSSNHDNEDGDLNDDDDHDHDDQCGDKRGEEERTSE